MDSDKGPWTILVLQRGWVFVGRRSQEGSRVTLHDAQNVRRWGTTRGLGQLAAEGPLATTQLDPAGVVSVHELAIVCEITCDASMWETAK